MRFHDYKTMRDHSWRGSTEEYLRWLLLQPLNTRVSSRSKSGCVLTDSSTLVAPLELSWVTHARPYYNVYPIAVDLCLKTSLNMKWGDISFPVRTLALRFAPGHEPLGMTAVLARVPSEVTWATPIAYHHTQKRLIELLPCFPLLAHIQTTTRASGGLWSYSPTKELREEVVSDSLVCSREGLLNLKIDHADWEHGDSSWFVDASNFLIRLLAFIGLLARGTDLITPAILASDREEYDTTTDEARKRWLEERARKKLGPSFDVGRRWEVERATSPHWRRPHLALFHTGPGRTVPVLKERSGCRVIPRDMSQVPTGFLGQETEEELAADHSVLVATRPAIPKRLRFLVLRRDGYRCQLCGLTQADGVQLEVDHKVPVAKGGKTDEDNLWTLCHPCNNGKSDLSL